MPLEYPFAIPPIKFELPYSTWTTNDAKSQLARVKADIIALDLPLLQQKARSPNADFAFFHALSESILTVKKLKVDQIAKLLAEHLSGLLGKASDVQAFVFTLQQQPRHWEAPLYGLLNLLEGEIEKEPKERDTAILQTVVSTLPVINKLVWPDLSFLLHEGAVGDHRRCLVSRTIYLMSQLPGKRAKMYDATTVGLVMHCWLFMSHNPVNRISASGCARYLFFQTEVIPPPPAGVLHSALQSVSLETFVSREKRALEDPGLLGEALAMEFKAVDPFSGHHSELSQALVDRKFHVSIVNALYRQVLDLEKKQKFDDETMNVFGEGGRLIQNILMKQTKARPASQLLLDVVANTRAIRVASVGFTLACITPDYFGDWLSFFDCLLRVANPTIPPQRGWLYYPVGNIRDEIRNALRHVYHNTSIRLLGTPGEEIGTNEYHRLWDQLGRDYVIEGHDSLTRDFFRSQRRCCNLQCFRAAYEIEHLQKCRKCKDTFYCSKECQKFDWKMFHKSECQRGKRGDDSDEDFLDVMPPKRFVFPAED